MESGAAQRASCIPPCPFWLLAATYLLYLGLVTRESLPIFAQIEWLHEGERLGTAQMVLDGGIPFRDVYLTHGLFSNIIRPLVAFWMFGESLAADRLFGLLVEPLSYVAAAFYVWKVFPTVSWRLIGLVGFALYPLHLEPRHIIVFLTLGFLTAWTYERRKIWLVVAGIFAGLAFVGSTLDHAGFLLGTVLALPVILLIEARLLRTPAAMEGGCAAATTLQEVALPLGGGVVLGLAPFLGYLVVTGTTGAFLNDTIQRVLFDTVVRRDPYPALSFMNAMWYVVPAFYVIVAASVMVRLRYRGEEHWRPLYPTLLFGVLSFGYAMRGCCEVYGKLAIVSFPFIVGLIYVLFVMDHERRQEAGNSRGRALVLFLTAAWTLAILFHALSREWGDKQFIPRVLFPVLAVLLLSATVAALTDWGQCRRWARGLTVACPLAAVILGACFFHDAKPHLLSAQLKKPRLVKDLTRLAPSLLQNSGRLTRDQPPYVRDELLSYLETASRRQTRAVILAVGAGVYYFLANTSPPNRFPEVYHAQVERSALEVVKGLERTGAEVLVACMDHGKAITGWPMNGRLSQFLSDRYTDSGQRVHSALLGPDCPFEVWVPRPSTILPSAVTG